MGPEADSDDRFAIVERLGDEPLLPGEPGIAVLLVDVHGPAEDHEPVEVIDRRQKLAGIQTRGRDAVASHHGPRLDGSRPLEGDVLQIMDAQLLFHHWQSLKQGFGSKLGA